ncbi:MAG TPA: hypothetical protein VGM93_07850 [Acidimicrobiales bacterium]
MGVSTLALGTWGALCWSLIPLGIHGKVSSTAWDEDGASFKVIVMRGGPTLTVDTRVYRELGGELHLPGEVLAKGVGDRTIRVGDRSVALVPSAACWKAIGTLWALVLFAFVRGWRRRRLPRRVGSAPAGEAERG